MMRWKSDWSEYFNMTENSDGVWSVTANLSLDNLFEILDCYIEMPSMWTNTDKTFTWPFTNVKYGNPTSTATANFEVPQKCD